ncbi:hypothetical protein GCM10023238_03090 [Streptomyces heliomycini]
MSEGGDARHPAGPHTVAELDLSRPLEAVLLVVDEPRPREHLRGYCSVPGRQVSRDALRELADEYNPPGAAASRAAPRRGRLALLPPAPSTPPRRGFVQGTRSAGPVTRAAMETLAVVAYGCRSAASRVSAVRGVNCDG